MSLSFFCKQKTAYELRISDWSSDVGSSDLCSASRSISWKARSRSRSVTIGSSGSSMRDHPGCWKGARPSCHCHRAPPPSNIRAGLAIASFEIEKHHVGRRFGSLLEETEEHTSELQSLMRISYAVFCLKKKKKHLLQETKAVE